MNKARREIQFSMSSLVLLLTVACVGIGIYSTWDPDPSIEVLVAAEHLDHKTVVTKKNTKFEKWPASIVPDGAITASDEFSGGVLT